MKVRNTLCVVSTFMILFSGCGKEITSKVKATDTDTQVYIKKTNQMQSYDELGEIVSNTLHDDGFYKKGIDSKYTYKDENNTSIVIDNITGLMWQNNENKKKKYSDENGNAKEYCTNLTLGNYNDWRLPEVEELESIIDYFSEKKPMIDKIFTNSKSYVYWTNTSYIDDENSVWKVSFSSTEVSKSLKEQKYYVRCVRGDQK